MSLVAEFELQGDSFPIGRVVGDGVGVEFERIVPTDKGVTPSFWVDTTTMSDVDRGLSRLESRLAESDAVNAYTKRATLADRALYRVRLHPAEGGLLQGFSRADATLLSATTENPWSVRARFPDHERVSTFSDYCEQHDVSYELTRLVPISATTDASLDVTPAQREALVRAVEGGYFAVPRGMTLSELADELDISKQAASERVRRAAGAVLRDVL
ncbi:MAG: helix-turn-helix domain-containing protein [Haloglomus sp.]